MSNNKVLPATKHKQPMKAISPWMGVAQLSNMEKIQQIRQGFDAVILKDVGEYFNLSEVRFLHLMGVPKTTAHRLIKKHERLNQNDSERLYRLAMVTKMAVDVLGSDENAKEWLTKPNFALQGAAPLEMLDTEPGAEIVKRILNSIETGGVL